MSFFTQDISTNQRSLDLMMRQLALESTVSSNVSELFRETVPALASKLQDGIHHILPFFEKNHLPDELRGVVRKYRSSHELISQMSFSSFRSSLVTVPEGFGGQINSFLETLINQQPAIFKESHDLLSDYCQTLSFFLTNREAKTGLSDHTAVARRVGRERQKLNNALNIHFTNKSNHGKAKLDTLVDRLSDLNRTADLLQTLSKIHDSSYLKQLKSQTLQAKNLLDMILRDLESQTHDKITPAAARNVAEGAREVASYLEFISVYFFRVEQAYGCSRHLFETVLKRV